MDESKNMTRRTFLGTWAGAVTAAAVGAGSFLQAGFLCVRL